MILLDPPVDYHGKFKACSHMVSDLIGEEGSRELMAFAVKIGMSPRWLQKRGTPHEHFDVFGTRRARAIAAGATEVDRRAMVNAFRRKRGLVEYPARAGE